ncbi:MAG TPA: exonuclease domain-containing protein [Ktedonobacteraceae bacterium]|nr:exonuclease domain-containing protein [Ktedonobacteraceae bacterium]
MARKTAIRVALDLETTGLHVEQDAILEVAAVKFQGTEILDTFESFVAPGRSIPYRVQRLTGIKPELLAGAPSFSAIAHKLQTFLGDFPIVGHSIPFDVSFLRRWGLARANPLIDTFELATVLLPSLSSYNLGQVAQTLGINVPLDRHRAMVDTRLAMEVFWELHQRLQSVDLTLLKDLANLDAPRSWPLLHFFRQELRERQEQDGLHGKLTRGSLGDRFAAQLGMDPRVLSFSISNQHEVQQNSLQSSDTSPVSSALDSIAQIESLVEVIPEQAEVPAPKSYQTARMAVREALEQCKPLLIEVTIGGGDYTPTLLPALEWLNEPCETYPRRLVISCSSQQHARRLVETILPRLQEQLKSELSVAYLAEHGGYLCTHRWFGSALRRTSGELTAEQARGLAKLGLWAQQTMTGERSELTLLPQELTAWERISSGVERIPSGDNRSGDSYQRCTYRRKGYCFVSLAEERVKAATIVVTTHTGLFDDLSRPHSLLAKIDRRLILDADLLEEENARWSSSELAQPRLLEMLNTIGTELPDGRYQGLLALAAPALRVNGPGGLSTTPTIAKSELDTRMLTWFQTLRQTRVAVEKLFGCFGQLLEESLQQGTGSGGRDKGRGEASARSHGGRNSEPRMDQPLRLSGQIRNLGVWKDTERAWQQVAQRLQAVVDLAHEAEKLILTTQRSRHRLDIGSGEDSSVAAELIAVAHQLLKLKQLGQQAMSFADSENVYWLRMPPPPPPFAQTPSHQRHSGQTEASATGAQPSENVPVLHTQLVQTSAFLRRLLLSDDSCTIFSGSALSVDNSFAFSRGALGLDNDACPALSVVTEHHEQTLLYMPNDVPEPNAPQYQRHLDETLIHLATALEGQLVALFTSHAALRSSYATIKPLLEARGILVVGQGVDGSPRQLWQIYRRQERVVALGTGSFWDGAEDIDQSPACLLIARLPMPVLNDPPIAARAEHYSDQLHQLTVPVAALRMRRALNRLVWNGTRRNAIVLFDRRVISKEYGSTILHSLPHCSQRQAAVSHMPETILDWLTGTGAWE